MTRREMSVALAWAAEQAAIAVAEARRSEPTEHAVEIATICRVLTELLVAVLEIEAEEMGISV